MKGGRRRKSTAVVFAVLIAVTVFLLPVSGFSIERDVNATWYLAEGSTAWGFSTGINIGNPNPESVTAKVTYMDPGGLSGSGELAGRYVELPPLSQVTVDPRWDLGDADFSTTVVGSDGLPIAVDRTMYWNGEGGSTGEAHNSMAVTEPSTSWYLPEGSSAWGFETWTLVQNPNGTEASIEITYMTQDASWRKVRDRIPAFSRATYSMEEHIGQLDAAVKVDSDVDVIAERSMYRNGRSEGSCSMGATTPASDYYLAEGTTAWGFTNYLLVQNPNAKETSVTVTYMTPDGPAVQPAFTMLPSSRKTIRVNDVEGVSNTDLSTLVHADLPIVAERAMYWNAGSGGKEACHASIGVPGASHSFLLPDGQTSNGRETFTLVQNPGVSEVTVDIDYLPAHGVSPTSISDTIPARSRRTYNMAESIPDGRAAVLVSVRGGEESIIVERSAYWDGRNSGVDSVGTGGEGTRNWPTPPPGCPYFSQDYSQPQSRSAGELAEFMSSEHLAYDLDGWFFFGNLVDPAMPDDPGTFIISMQRIRTPYGDEDYQLVPAIVAYYSPTLETYVYGGAQTIDQAPFVTVESDPWKVQVFNPYVQAQAMMTMSLASGVMGQPGATYDLSCDCPDNLGGRLQTDVKVRDRMGVVSQGYGTTAFFPVFSTSPQQNEIDSLHGGSMQSYLEDTGDPMTCQGEYYYSMPLMDVQSFDITWDGIPLSSGNEGVIWTDYIVNSYDGRARDVLLNDCSWRFFSIMLPEEDAAIMVIELASGEGVMQLGNLFTSGGERTRNTALQPSLRWKSVDIQPVPGSKWTSPDSGKTYYLEYRIRLGPDHKTDLDIKIGKKQEILTPDGRAVYEGLGKVTGTLDGKPVTGTTVTELESVDD